MAILQGGIALASVVASSRAGKRAEAKARRERERQEREIRQRAEASSALVLEAAEGAAAPLKRIADTTQDLRSPLLREAISTGVRQQAEAQAQRESSQGGALTGQRRSGNILSRLLSSQGLGAAENARIQRVQQNLALRAQLLQQAGAIRTEGASRAASIQSQAESTVAGLPQVQSSGGGVLPGALGGLAAVMGNLSDEQNASVDGFFGKLLGFGGDDTEDVFANLNSPELEELAGLI